MNKLTFIFSLSFLFFSSSIFSQSKKWEFGVTLKSNFIVLDIEDDIYDTRPAITDNDALTSFYRTPEKANRTISGKLGVEGGLKLKYNLFERFSLISGIEGRFIRYEVSQEVEQKIELISSFTTLGSWSIPGNPWGAIQADVIGRDQNGNPIEEGMELEVFNFNEVNQNLFYLNIPINIGYTTKSEKLTFFGGFWYAYLLAADIEESTFFPNEPISYFEKSVFGVNGGIDWKVISKFAISLNYSGLSSNFYKKTKIITVSNFNNNMIELSKEEVQIPSSKGFNLISLGLTYQL